MRRILNLYTMFFTTVIYLNIAGDTNSFDDECELAIQTCLLFRLSSPLGHPYRPLIFEIAPQLFCNNAISMVSISLISNSKFLLSFIL